MKRNAATLREVLADKRVLLLDGATGTELERRGVSLAAPTWSAAAIVDQPHALQRIHTDYVAAGAELITANTFRTHRRSLVGSAFVHREEELTRQAVRLARLAAGESAWVLGSLAPLGDCYSPEQTADETVLFREHCEQVAALVAAGVDGILVETQVSIAEATAAAQAASESGSVVFVSFVLRPDGMLLTGEGIEEAVQAILPMNPEAVLFNCLPAPIGGKAVERLTELMPRERRCGIYANTGWMNADRTWQSTAARHPEIYADCAEKWIAAGATVVGGCCGTTPSHIAAVTARLRRTDA